MEWRHYRLEVRHYEFCCHWHRDVWSRRTHPVSLSAPTGTSDVSDPHETARKTGQGNKATHQTDLFSGDCWLTWRRLTTAATAAQPTPALLSSRRRRVSSSLQRECREEAAIEPYCTGNYLTDIALFHVMERRWGW